MTEEKTNEETPKEEKAPEAPKEETPKVEEKAPEAPKEETGADVEVPKKFEKIVKEIEEMSVIDLHELVQIFEKKFGVSAQAVAAAAPAGGDGGGDADAGGVVTITLEDAGAQKIQVIKIVKEILALGLKEAKDIVDGAPKVVKEGVVADEAENIKKQLEEVGAKVSVK